MVGGAGILRGDAVRIPLRTGSVSLIITSPPYFALRSYQDEGDHYGGQIGSEAGPVDFLRALWAVADESHRVLEDGGSAWWNLGDKMAGSGGHNNATLGMPARKMDRPPHTPGGPIRPANPDEPRNRYLTKTKATRRQAPDRYNQAADVRAKSLMGLPWRFAMGLICPDLYRAPFEPAACWHDDGPGPCRTCPPRRFPQWIGRAEVVWKKPNGLPESVTDRVRRSHEQWFHVVKSGRYFAGIDEVREVQMGSHAQATRSATVSSNGGNSHRAMDKDSSAFNPLGKLPGSVKSVASAPLSVPESFISTDGVNWRAHGTGARSPAKKAAERRELWELGEKQHANGDPLYVRSVDHFAAFPPEWPRWIIAGWSPTGICTACERGRRPVRGVDWSKVPHRMERKRVLTERQSARWCSAFADWCAEHGIARGDLDVATGTSDMGGWWASRLPHRSAVPTPEQWAKLAAAFGPLPAGLAEVVHSTELVPVALRDIEDVEVQGKHRMGGGGLGESVVSIAGYACACPDTSAPTRPAVVLDPFGGTGTTAMMARAMGRFGVQLDLSRDYNRLARWRIWESGHAEKALGKLEKKPAKKPAKKPRRVAAALAAARYEQLTIDLGAPPAVADVPVSSVL